VEFNQFFLLSGKSASDPLEHFFPEPLAPLSLKYKLSDGGDETRRLQARRPAAVRRSAWPIPRRMSDARLT